MVIMCWLFFPWCSQDTKKGQHSMCTRSTQLYSTLKKEQHSIRMDSIKGSVHCTVHSPVHSPVHGPGFTLSHIIYPVC